MTGSACAAIGWRGKTLETRCLTSTELVDWYLPMRFDVLRRELNWTVGDVRTPIDLRDAYDPQSIAFGVLRARSHLIGAARLILPVAGDDLPSLRLLRSLGRHRRFALPTAEISRVMVRRDFRKLGVFRILLLSSLLVAHDAKVRTLIISERDEARFARTMSNYGFVRFADGFSFMDEMIAPNEPAATYVLEVHRNLDADSRQAIAGLREVLLRAAEALLTAGEADRNSDFG
jgi:predicted GNAT family N-acyltransferase